MTLWPWQKWLYIHALELLPSGEFRFRTVVILVARQNGKSTWAQILSLFFLYVLGVALVIGTAQNLDVAEEVWAGAVEIAQDTPELEAEIKKVHQVNGKKALELWGGERYKVQAANRRGGRGLSGDLVLLDELREHQSWDAWAAVTKTTLARLLAIVVALSNAGDATSVVLRHLRMVAHSELGDPDGINRAVGDLPVDAEVAEIEEDADVDSALGLFEWSAPPGCPIDDEEGIAQANPSYNYSITPRAIRAAQSSDPEWTYRTEVMCQWSDGALVGPFPPGAWDAGLDPESEVADPGAVTYAIDIPPDRARTHVAIAGRREDGDMHVEIVASRVGIEWVLGWFKERADPEANPMRVVVQGRGAVASGLADDLERIPGVTVVPWEGKELGIGCGRFWDAVAAHVADGEETARRVWHRAQPVLDVAAATAVTRPVGDGAWAWDRTKSQVDIAPLVAVTAALWDQARPTETQRRSAYEDDDYELVVID